MTRYRVTQQVKVNTAVDVDADSREEAERRARDARVAAMQRAWHDDETREEYHLEGPVGNATTIQIEASTEDAV